jgi:hypothetical protein
MSLATCFRVSAGYTGLARFILGKVSVTADFAFQIQRVRYPSDFQSAPTRLDRARFATAKAHSAP